MAAGVAIRPVVALAPVGPLGCYRQRQCKGQAEANETHLERISDRQ